MRGPIVLLTDFGNGYFQGVMKGVILSRAPGATVVDLDHHVPLGGIGQAAFVLAAALPYFPRESVFACVVDPGVGTGRRCLVAALPEGQLILAPDNGLLSAVLSPRSCVLRELTNQAWFLDDDTATFEGRSRFAPAAAALAAGARPDDAGPLVTDPVLLDVMKRRLTPTGVEGAVIYVDPFGNLVTGIDQAALAASGAPEELLVWVAGATIRGISRTYGAVESGALLAYVGSTGHLEIALRDGSAASRLRVAAGAPIVVRRREGHRS